MTIFVLTSTATSDMFITTDATVTPAHLLETGHLRAYTLRENGTMRHLELAPVGSAGGDTAEWISEQCDEGMTVRAVAREVHASVATVRRFLLSLELTEQIEAGAWDDLRFGPDGEPQWLDLPSEDEEATEEEPAPLTDGDFATFGSDCEPVGTTGDQLAAALAASLA